MSVKIVKGDMVKHLASEDHFDAYAHQANCFCTMKRGIAPLLVKEEPTVATTDLKTAKGDITKLGTYSVTCHSNNAFIFNIYGQYHWSKYQVAEGRITVYTALESGLEGVKSFMECHHLKTLGLPFIGCGLAGGDWDNVVYPMIKNIFTDSDIDVTIFEL